MGELRDQTGVGHSVKSFRKVKDNYVSLLSLVNRSGKVINSDK